MTDDEIKIQCLLALQGADHLKASAKHVKDPDRTVELLRQSRAIALICTVLAETLRDRTNHDILSPSPN